MALQRENWLCGVNLPKERSGVISCYCASIVHGAPTALNRRRSIASKRLRTDDDMDYKERYLTPTYARPY